MAEIRVKAYAKLNLTLDILRRRSDGYHDLRMVMQSISLHDIVYIRETGNGDIEVSNSVAYLPCDRSNLAYHAAEVFFDATGIENPGIRIEIDKVIPVCAGMAGGSSDAAAVLRGLRELYAPDISIACLCRIGEQVGSDVPYCVFGGTALAEGRGEILTRLPAIPDCWVVLCKPPFPVSTPELFSCVQTKRLICHPDTKGMIQSLEKKDLPGILHRIYNVFEEVLPDKYDEVYSIKSRLMDLGALSACMTGSGPTVFGIFTERKAAETAMEVLKKEYDQTYFASMIHA